VDALVRRPARSGHNFEVYLEKAREEVLAHQGAVGVTCCKIPSWEKLKAFFGQLG
jgi:hypothetical protein